MTDGNVMRMASYPYRPRDDAERDAARQRKVALCCSPVDPGFRCTRTLGHRDDHVACDHNGLVVARWPSRAFTAVHGF